MTADRGRPTADGALERALRRIALRRRVASLDGERLAAMAAPEFRAVVAERLRALERELGEVRARINGLLFVVAGAVITQLVLRLIS